MNEIEKTIIILLAVACGCLISISLLNIQILLTVSKIDEAIRKDKRHNEEKKNS